MSTTLKEPSTKSASTAKQQTPPLVKTVNLALQGGGAHGAFTWGVLDRLLQEKNLNFEGISATSAGAMNGTLLAYGLATGGPEGARKALTSFWKEVSDAAMLGPLQPSPIDRMLKNYSLEFSPAFTILELVSHVLSPYQLNPMNYNPLRDVLEKSVKFDVLRSKDCPVKLFLSATNVRTSRIKIFKPEEINASAVMASACLPFMFQAVEIDGEAYWDGGYMGNPALYPLIYDCQSADIVIIHINPIHRTKLPQTATEILNRINEISFNSSLMREMRAVNFVTKLIEKHQVIDTSIRHMFMHSIMDEKLMAGLGVASKLNADWEFLTHLRDAGYRCAEEWLGQNFAKLGVESSADIVAEFL
jgi:NTE family protein